MFGGMGGGMPGGMGGGMPGGPTPPGGPVPKDDMQKNMLMKLMSNPKTAAYFQDPEFMAKLSEIQKNPQNITKHLNDPKIMEAFKVITEGMGPGMNMPGGEDEGQSGDMPNFDMPNFDFKPQQTPNPPKKEAPIVCLGEEEKKLGNAAYKAKNFDLAISHYDKAIELEPKNLLYYSNKCAVLIEQKNFDTVIEVSDEGKRVFCTLEFSERNTSHLAKLIGRKGRATWLKGDIDAAIKVYEDALLEATDSQLSTDLKELKKLKVANEKAAYLNSDLGDQHRDAGNEFFKLGKYGDCIREFDEALKRNPKDYKALANKSSAYTKLMEFGMALNAAEESIKIEPTYIKAHIRKANCHRALKEFHKALDCYDTILKLEPGNEEAKKGKMETGMAIQMSMHEGNDEDRLKRAMQDPEIQSIMMDPMVKIALNQMQSDPKNAQSYFTDATLGPKLQKLIQAGVLKVA